MTERAWLLKAPAYDGGVWSEQDFNIGYGKSIQEDTQTSRMQLVANTNDTEYLAYLAKLEKAGYTKIFENEINGNLHAEFLAPEGTLYVYFIRKFKKNIGVTPYAYILNLRLGVAGELRAGGMSLSEAAARVGFHHPSSYCHALEKSEK